MGTFEELLAKALAERDQQASKYVPDMYYALTREDGMSPPAAGEYIFIKCLPLWKKDTIRKLLPLNARNGISALAARRKAKRYREQLAESNNGKNGTAVLISENENTEHDVAHSTIREIEEKLSRDKSILKCQLITAQETIGKLEQENMQLRVQLEKDAFEISRLRDIVRKNPAFVTADKLHNDSKKDNTAAELSQQA